MKTAIPVLSLVFAMAAGSALAEFARIDSQSEFDRHVVGKTLTRPLVEVRVTPDGRIEGYGSMWDVTGNWSWRDGYFCRDLYWGGDALGYNCQEVQLSNGGRVRFTSDKGTGMSAVFRLK
jgi:hypothetical protein